MAKVTIHGFPPSTYTRSARMAAIEVGVEHELKAIAYGQPEHFALHPFGKMPILTDNDATVYETVAILAHLDARYGEGALLAASTLVENLATTSALMDYAYRSLVHHDAEDSEAGDAARRVFDWLESLLKSRPFLAGEAFGAADILAAPMLDHHVTEFDAADLLPVRSKLHAWYGALHDRRSFAETGVAAE